MLARETIDAFKDGDPGAFARLMREYGDVVRGAAARMFSGIFDQEEAMQEVWLHIWKNRASIDADRAAELSGFIAVTARRKCIDIARRRDPSRPQIEIDDDNAPVVAAHGASVVAEGELVAAARAFASTLKPSWRSFFQLHFVDGLTFEEIGARLGIGRLRCKYMKKVIAARARSDVHLLAALRPSGGRHAP